MQTACPNRARGDFPLEIGHMDESGHGLRQRKVPERVHGSMPYNPRHLPGTDPFA
jgi:hypothetical protein